MNGVVQKSVFGVVEFIGRLRGVSYQAITCAEEVMSATVPADGEYIVEGHILVLVGRDRLQLIRYTVEDKYAIALISEEDV